MHNNVIEYLSHHFNTQVILHSLHFFPKVTRINFLYLNILIKHPRDLILDFTFIV